MIGCLCQAESYQACAGVGECPLSAAYLSVTAAQGTHTHLCFISISTHINSLCVCVCVHRLWMRCYHICCVASVALYLRHHTVPSGLEMTNCSCPPSRYFSTYSYTSCHTHHATSTSHCHVFVCGCFVGAEPLLFSCQHHICAVHSVADHLVWKVRTNFIPWNLTAHTIEHHTNANSLVHG